MTSLPAAVRRGLRNLPNFQGRDTRSQFWFYMLGLFIAYQVLSVLLVVPVMATHIGAADSAASGPADADAFASIFRTIMIVALAVPIIGVALTAAAIVRRLHDCGLSGWWGALPLPFLIFGIVSMYRLFSSFGQPGLPADRQLFATTFANNGVYVLTILVLIVLLVKDSDPSPNRFGASSRKQAEDT